MNFISAFNELDKLYESLEEENKVSLKESKVKSTYSCAECGFEGDFYDDEVEDGSCPQCHDHHGAFDKCEESLAEELSPETKQKTIEWIADHCRMMPKNPSTSFITDVTETCNKAKEITVEEVEAAIDGSEYPDDVKNLAATMKENNFKTIGDLGNYFTDKFITKKESLTENTEEDAAADVAIIDSEIAEIAEVPEDTAEEVVNKPIVLECIKCGALVIKDESEVTIDEEADLANVGEECPYCEESEGFKAIGTFEPYVVETAEEVAPEEDTEVVEDEVVEEDETVSEALMEGKIKDSIKKVATRLGADGATVIRAFGELISDVMPGDSGEALYDAVTDLENRATLKALMNGNEKVLNTMTVEDIEELKQDIEEYKKSKEAKKADEDELEEGIFDKKPDVKMNNARREFASEVEAITGGDSLADMAYELTSKLRDSISDYKYYEEKKANHQTDNISMQRVFKSKAEQILKLYAELIKTLKKPTNFYAPYSVISSAIRKVLGGYSSDSDILSRIRDYGEKLNKIGAIQADKKVKAAELADFYKKIVNGLDSDYRLLQKKPTHTLFEELAEEDELEELLDITPSINLNLSGGTGNDVDVL